MLTLVARANKRNDSRRFRGKSSGALAEAATFLSSQSVQVTFDGHPLGASTIAHAMISVYPGWYCHHQTGINNDHTGIYEPSPTPA